MGDLGGHRLPPYLHRKELTVERMFWPPRVYSSPVEVELLGDEGTWESPAADPGGVTPQVNSD